MLQAAEKAGILVVGPMLVESGAEEDYRRFFLATSQDGADALLVDASAEHLTKQQLLIELAVSFRLPTIYPSVRSWKRAGSCPMGLILVRSFAKASLDRPNPEGYQTRQRSLLSAD